MRSRTAGPLRKFSRKKAARVRPNCSLPATTMAVCGIGSPSGRRNERDHREPIRQRSHHRRLQRGEHVRHPIARRLHEHHGEPEETDRRQGAQSPTAA